ncbi:hypothetical protein CQ018_07120 [Arthrobacter sp. MYb227]|uniref:hypothetical protein n=1 Tax=Arthrobacter sp. MYb227 TaxID=1848601 RepID=UPI000CFE1359|nr:hypothetical protein [Arthrobacter sp. MYb227]PQZ95091.1 hypothetical protein CQ018_07120 [Arthrobacter sp. MYb227]
MSKRAAFERLHRGSSAGRRLIDAGVLSLRSVDGYKEPRIPEALVDFLAALPRVEAKQLETLETGLQIRCVGATVRLDANEKLDPESTKLARHLAASGIPTREAKFYGIHLDMSLSQAINNTCGWWSMGPMVAGTPPSITAPIQNYPAPFTRVLVTVAGLALLDLQTSEIIHRNLPDDATAKSYGVVIHTPTPEPQSLVGHWIADPDDGRTLRRFGHWNDTHKISAIR